jgi:hypothetical protein
MCLLRWPHKRAIKFRNAAERNGHCTVDCGRRRRSGHSHQRLVGVLWAAHREGRTNRGIVLDALRPVGASSRASLREHAGAESALLPAVA